jgi:Tfp pilus assembly protein PilN
MTGVNLIPAHRLTARQRRAHLRAWACGLCGYAIAVAVACAAVTLLQVDPETGEALNRVESTRAANRKASASLVEAAKRVTAAQSAQRMVRVLSDQPDWSLLFTALANHLDDDAVLRDVRLRSTTASGGKPDGGPARYKLELRGLGRTQAAVSRFVAELERADLFDEVRLLRTGREPFLTGTAVTFDLDCTLGEGGKR